LACSPLLNRRIAAFAGVAAAFYTDAELTEPLFGAGCKPEVMGNRKIPIMQFHGLNDSIIAYDGDNRPAPNTIPVPEWVGGWVWRDGCTGKRPGVRVLGGGNVTRFGWSCEGWRDVVVHYKIRGFGHGWPSTVWLGEPWEELRLGPTRWNATGVIMEWFKRWSLGNESGPTKEQK
jgi:poly(3-hydroxybutyrate) depolymerase